MRQCCYNLDLIGDRVMQVIPKTLGVANGRADVKQTEDFRQLCTHLGVGRYVKPRIPFYCVLHGKGGGGGAGGGQNRQFQFSAVSKLSVKYLSGLIQSSITKTLYRRETLQAFMKC